LGKGSAPAPPNPALTAQAQSGANVDTAASQAALNAVNQFTPYGSTTYDITGNYTTPGGQTVPTYTQNTSLSPAGQQILTGAQGAAVDLLPSLKGLTANAADSLGQRLNFATPYQGQLASAPGQISQVNPAYAAELGSTPQMLDQNATNAIYGQQKSFLDPQWNQNQQQLQDQLSRQGIPVGSEAYNNAMTQLNNSKTQAYQSAQDSAVSGGSAAAANLFNLALAGQGADTSRQQAGFNAALQGNQENLAEQQLAQTNPLQLIQSLFGATPASPQQPIATPGQTGVSPTNVIGAQQLSTDAANQSYQANTSSNNAMFGGLASIAGAAAIAI